TILANKSTNDFNQSIPTAIINTLFQNPVGLSNLHQSWFMNHTKRSESNLNILIQISYSRLQKNFSYSYQSETNIKQSFCNKTEFNKTFLINSSDAIVPKKFLCNNLSATDLKLFLISVQNQLDDILLTNIAPDMIKFTMGGMQ
ncbi:unnamed protein product, partial [Adineta steineri]